ncbi:MAG: hypothetical protein HAW59_04865 [Betaproteobacteria bacterium]|nr:hypothetical protein [Betaproteobacteria bacterium]
MRKNLLSSDFVAEIIGIFRIFAQTGGRAGFFAADKKMPDIDKLRQNVV